MEGEKKERKREIPPSTFKAQHKGKWTATMGKDSILALIIVLQHFIGILCTNTP